MRMLALALLLAGCPGKQPADPSHTAAGPKPCEKMADHVVSIMTGDKAPEKPTDSFREAQDKLTRVLIERCTQDRWTVDAQQCFQKIQSMEQFDSCAPLMTVEQRDALPKAIDAAFPKTEGAGSGG